MPRSPQDKPVSKPDLVTRVIQVTPQEAEKWLKLNHNNRSLRELDVARYKKAMDEGRWAPDTGEAIKFDRKGHLVDGQHRLTALARCDKPQWFTVVYGVSEFATLYHDTGRKRTNGDQLHRLGYKNSVALAAAAKLVVSFVEGKPLAKGFHMEAPLVIRTVEKLPGLSESLDVWGGKQGLGSNIGRGAVPAAFHYLFSKVDPQKADSFFLGLSSGVGLTPGCPVLGLRERLTQIRTSHKTVLTDRVKYFLTIRAWNYYCEGKAIKRLQSPRSDSQGLPPIKGNPLMEVKALLA